MNTEINYKGFKFNLNNNRIGISRSNYELFPKYKVLVFYESEGKWFSIGNAETKKEAKEIIRQWINGER